MKINCLRPLVFAAAITLATAGLSGDAAERPRSHQLLVGIGPPAPFNLEEPFINMAQARRANWNFEFAGGKRMSGREAISAGYLDPKTQMPTKKAAEAKFAEIAAFYSGAEQLPDYYADEFVLDWEGEARGYMQRWEGQASAIRNKNSVTYSFDRSKVKSGVMRFSSIGEGFSNVRLYRKKYASLLQKGEIWNPDFIDYVRRYDIVRTMDLQYTNNSLIRRFDQIAKMSNTWGQPSGIAWPEAPYYSIPYEVLFNLGVKADVAIWLTVPPQLGSPISAADPSLRKAKIKAHLDTAKLRAAASANAAETLSSPEWGIFAKAFVDRYLASGYPLDRPLYIEVGNEIWNFSGGFFISSNYASGIAEGAADKKNIGQGYGVLVARYMMALEKEFAVRKIKPNVVYVIATQTANTWRTEQALEGAAGYLKKMGADPKAYFSKTAVSVTNYHGNFNAMSDALFDVNVPAQYAPLWIAEIEKDPKGFAKRISTLLTSGPKHVKGNGPWLIARFAEHKAIAEKAGSRLLGCYEGGSHLLPPKELTKSATFMKWWMDYHWSEESAEVARQINRDLINAFPGIVIANYKSMGVLAPNAPWHDGHYAKSTPMLEMWDELARQDRIN